MRLLFLSAWFPYPPINGVRLRVYNVLRQLSRRHAVTLISFADRPDVDPDAPSLRALCDAIDVVPWKPFQPGSRRALMGFASPVPRSIVATHSPEMAHRIQTTLARVRPDAVVASTITAASYHRHFAGLPALLEEIEVAALYDQFARAGSTGRRFRAGLTWAKHRRYLAQLLPHFGACTVVSAPERDLLRHAAPGYGPIEIIPNCVALSDYAAVREERRPQSLIFTGALSYAANHDAMCWFLRDVYPIVRTRVPDACLTITGDHGRRALPPAPAVVLTGLVDDVRPRIASACVSVVPVRRGGGTRLKILEAMALGTPVVSTAKGAEGLEVVDGEHVLIADDPRWFAERVVELLADAGLRRRLGANARRLVEEKYDWATVGPRLVDLVERVAQSPPARLASSARRQPQ